MPNVFPSNIVLNVVFYVLFVGILNFLPIFSNFSIPNFPIPNFSTPNFSPRIFHLEFFNPEFFKVKMAQRCWSAAGPLPPVYLCLAAPLRLCAFAPLRLCAFAPLRHCPFDSLLHSPTEPSFCSFCEQKQRISGAVAHCSTWNTVHFVNRSSEAMEQWPIAPRGTLLIL